MSYLPAYLPWHPLHQNSTDIRVADQRISITGDRFAEWVAAAAEQFADLGFTRGNVAATFLPNRLELLVALCAAWRLGGAVTPINPTFTTDESAHQVTDASVKLVIGDPALLVNGDPQDYFPGATFLPVDELQEEPRHTEPFSAPDLDPSDIAFIIYTSGSTGRPKGVLLDHGNVDAMTAAMAEVAELNADSHALMPLPLFHVNALHASFLSPYRCGGRLTILDRFEPVAFATAVHKYHPTYFSAVPALYSYLLALPEDMELDFSSLKFGICGAAPASAKLVDAFESRFGVRVLTGYGLTEGTCVSTFTRPSDPHHPEQVGRALPGQEVRISDGHGGFAPTGVAGEVLIRGANVMRGYLNRPDATAAAIQDQWLHTGDVGVLDNEGFLTIVDRIKDLIIRGGENLYPSEIEAAIISFPHVQEAAVVAAPHPTLGEVPVAFFTTDGDQVDTVQLHEHLSKRLAKVKLPVRLTAVADFPRNPVGKISKIDLRKQAAAVGDAGAAGDAGTAVPANATPAPAVPADATAAEQRG